MATGLGFKIGNANCVAVAADATSWDGSISHPTEELLASGPMALMPSAVTAHVGDPVAVVDETGRAHTGDDLYTHVLGALSIAADSALDPGSPTLAVACPDEWSPATRASLTRSVERLAPGDVTLVPESLAVLAAVAAGRGERNHDGGTVVVYDLGATAAGATVVRTGPGAHIIGRPLRSSTISGSEFDRLLLAHVLQITGCYDGLDVDDPATIEALTVLRARCRAAKEALSNDTDTVVDVSLPGVSTQARLVRDDIEELLRTPILESVQLVRDSLANAGVDIAEVSSVIISGGGAAIPLVTELFSTILRLPVLVDPEPATASAAGAALVAVDRHAALVADEPETIVATRPDELSERRPIAPAPVTPTESAAPRRVWKRGMTIAVVAAGVLLATGTGVSVGTGLIGGTSSTNGTAPTAGADTTTATTKAPGSTRATGAAAASTAASTPAGTVRASDGTLVPVSSASANQATGGAAAAGSAGSAAAATRSSGGTNSGSSGSTGSSSGGSSSSGSSNSGTSSGGSSSGGSSSSGSGNSGSSSGGSSSGGDSSSGSNPTAEQGQSYGGTPGDVLQVPGKALCTIKIACN
ncbi:Hsp70 family protein [Williamsia sterculiae]|uniref:Hsp70 protein n=1 Tax=Williamsia sterculiae TaxID=1344003 RepID=A0A1N7CJM7_9NOCA|nr:Hsp70 family protein [Williamsia sterculiae]SIR63733.1 Hsp70 protein [Williamsia sterculiae]